MSAPLSPKHERFRKLSRQQRRAFGRKNDALYRAKDTCPRCGLHSVFAGPELEDSATLDTCVLCEVIWERETRAVPERERCDNCAFRPGSPEQQDPARWREIVDQTIRARGVFYCHKRVPAAIDATIEKGTIEFQHERNEQGYCSNAPVCAGWLAARLSAARIEGLA